MGTRDLIVSLFFMMVSGRDAKLSRLSSIDMISTQLKANPMIVQLTPDMAIAILSLLFSAVRGK